MAAKAADLALFSPKTAYNQGFDQPKRAHFCGQLVLSDRLLASLFCETSSARRG
jgi:hypothetical protein